MAHLLAQILSFPPHPPPASPLNDSSYDAAIKDQITLLKKQNIRSLLQETSSGEYLYNILNPALNTIPYAFILLAMSDARKGNPEDALIWQKLELFLQNFDTRQIRYIGAEFMKIVEFTIRLAQQNRQIGLGAAVPVISRALLRLDPEGSMLTSIHLQLVTLALDNRSFQLVPAVISRPVLYFPGKISTSRIQFLCNLGLPNHAFITPTTGLTNSLKATEILNYFIISGSIFIVLGQWEKAVEALEDAICYPCKDNGTSKIMVEAYKKWILAKLLWKGKVGKTPATISSHTIKTFHALAKPYETIAELFSTATALRLKEEADIGRSIWKEDRNVGLMMKVLGAYQKHQIRALANVYSAISIPEITAKTCSAETGKKLPDNAATERLVREMIAEGSLNASVRGNPGGTTVLSFEPVQALTESEMAQKLRETISSIEAVTKNLKQTDHRLTEDKEYLKWVNKQRWAGNKAPVSTMYSAQEEMDLTWNGPDVLDEDLMST